MAKGPTGSEPEEPRESGEVQRPLFERERVAPTALWVRTSHEEVEPWDRRRIVEALVREARVDFDTAEQVAAEVQRDILLWDVKVLTAPLVRELVNAKLIERGLEVERRLHARVGVPIYNARSLILRRDGGRRAAGTTPAETDAALAGLVKREYALLEVYSGAVADAHARGALHLHGLPQVDRPYACVHSALGAWTCPGVVGMPERSRPPATPEAFVQWIGRATRALRSRVTGSIGWAGVNLAMAPLLADAPAQEIAACAQLLLGELVTDGEGIAGLPLLTDLHLWCGAPGWSADWVAVASPEAPAGDCARRARELLLALLRAYAERTEPPPLSPRLILHLTAADFDDPAWRALVEGALGAARATGNVEFAFDRNGEVAGGDAGVWQPSGKVGQWAMGCVTLNLPRVAYRARDELALFAELDRVLAHALEASAQKRLLLEQLAREGGDALGSELAPRKPRAGATSETYFIGLLGLAEMLSAWPEQRGRSGEEIWPLACEVVGYLRAKCEELSARYGMPLSLHQSPAESAAHRLAKLDADPYREQAQAVLAGRSAAYYTNSTWIDTSAALSARERVAREGELHHLLLGRRATQLWLGEDSPTPSEAWELLRWAVRETGCCGLAFAPEITLCRLCGRKVTGLRSQCDRCLTDQVTQWARVGGRMLPLSETNAGAVAEVFARHRGPRQYQNHTGTGRLPNRAQRPANRR